MRRVCLTLPTNRECAATISAMAGEAAHAAGRFGAEVHLTVLDSCRGDVLAGHARAVSAVSAANAPNVIARHLDEAAQRAFLGEVIARSGAGEPGRLLDLMLPAENSYGACTNRAFLIASALGCDSVHRRDSDFSYQTLDGVPVYPIHHELTSLGKSAEQAAKDVSETILDPECARRPVSMVGGSFVGELSVDIGEIRELDKDVYYDIVSLWAPGDWTEAEKRKLVDVSFRGSDTAFTRDQSTLAIVDPMHVDMHNIAFHRVHEQIPLPPATSTIGSDYFLIHVVHDAGLPGVRHNRDIVNFHTPWRKTESGFAAYQMRFVKFLLSMLYLNFVYGRMAEAGAGLLDGENRVRAPAIAEIVRESTRLAGEENKEKLDILDRSYRRLGGKYATFADIVASRGQRLLDEARQDMEDFALLIESWDGLVRASKAVSVDRPGR